MTSPPASVMFRRSVRNVDRLRRKWGATLVQPSSKSGCLLPQVKIEIEGLEAESGAHTEDGRRYRLPEADGAAARSGSVQPWTATRRWRQTLTPLPGERRTLSLASNQ